MANEEITKVAEIKQEYLTDFFTFLTFMLEKQKIDREEDEYQEAIRKAKHGR